MECHFIFLIIITTAEYGIGQSITTFERDLVKVKSGFFHKCMLDGCSPNSGTLLTCATHECGELEKSDKTAQGVDIGEVYLEKYPRVSDGKDELALHVEWSPIDNVSSSNLKGFKIGISDGITQYSLCYQVNASLKWNFTKNEVFLNDCFGKGIGIVTPGSNIRVSIVPLPLYEDGSSQETILMIEVPYCTNEDLHSLPICSLPGGRPTSRPCIDNCTTGTSSVTSNQINYINCAIGAIFQPLLPIKTCPRVRNTTGTPTQPAKVLGRQEWYKFYDEEDSNKVKLALNISWSPREDSSIKDLIGYEVKVVPKGIHEFKECFSITTDLIQSKHHEAVFYYDCFGRNTNPFEVLTGHKYSVFIASLPNNGKALTFDVIIPTCAHSEVQDTQECVDNTNRRMAIKVEEVFCSNRSMKVSYFATKEYDGQFIIRFCENGTYDSKKCKVELEEISMSQHSGTLHFSLPSSANLSIGYHVFIQSIGIIETDYDNANFEKCVVVLSNAAIGFIVAICLVVLAMAVLIIWYLFLRHKCGFWIFKKTKPPRPEYHVSARHPPNDDNDIPVKLPGSAKVYVVFADDHELHRNVIHWFCSFLQRDLGLTIKVHIWELNTTAFSRPQYVLNNLRESDKVVVICSEGSNFALESTEASNMYAPVIRQLCADSLAARNPEKYVIGYFNYTREESIPNMLHSHIKMYSPAFKLMEELEKFYFRLLGVEQYQDQGILKINEIDQFFEPERMSESALKLQHAIAKMAELTRINPTWYEDLRSLEAQMEKQTEPFSQAPTALQQYESLMDFPGDQSSITHLIAATPPRIRNDKREHGNAGVVTNGKNIGQVPPRNPAIHNHHKNLNGMTARSPPQQNGGSVGYHAQNETVRWTSPTRQPAEHADREPCEHDASVANGDASFEISESEDLSSVAPSKQIPSNTNKQLSHKFEHPPKSDESIIYNNSSYHPESFNTGDFKLENDAEHGYDSQVLTFLPSTSTQATDLDGRSLQQQSEEVDRLMNKALIRKPSTSNSPESGLFTLAGIDEEDDLELEDQIKSINLSSNF